MLAAAQVHFGYLSYNSVLKQMPEYQEAQKNLTELKTKYDQEAKRGEEEFQRKFPEFLQGQKDFPQAILLKRQRDLQDAMEKSLAFRRECDRLLRQAEHEMMAPLRQQVDEVIAKIGASGNYAFVLPAKPLYVNPGYCDDITALAISKLKETH